MPESNVSALAAVLQEDWWAWQQFAPIMNLKAQHAGVCANLHASECTGSVIAVCLNQTKMTQVQVQECSEIVRALGCTGKELAAYW